jgi:CRP/FNR family transcriptional regulator, cyclic AMP receptor protein
MAQGGLETEWLVEHLGKSGIFTSLTEGARRLLAERMRRRVYRAGAYIFNKGDVGISLYIIVRGRVKLVDPIESGEEIIITVLKSGAVLGELSLFDGAPRSATAEALDDVELLALAREDFIAALRSFPDMALALLAGLARTIRRMNGEVEAAIFLDLPGRVAKKLLELSKETDSATLQITQTELADTVGATRVSVNKILGDFAANGAVRLGKGRIEIVAPELLARRIVY